MSSHFLRTVLLAAAIFVSTLVPAAATSALSGMAATAGNLMPAVHGAQRFLVVLCRFADRPAEIEPPAYFTNLLLGPAPSLDDYWREVSAGQITLAGSEVTGWRRLPGEEREYVKTDGSADTARAGADCIAQAASSNDLHAYSGIVTVFNRNLDSRPMAGRLSADLAGARQCFQVIWMWPAWLHGLSGWAHEMGHVFGLPHSSDASNAAYANPWDVMSGFSGCPAPQYPIADQLNRLGWIPAGRKVVVPRDGSATVDLLPLTNQTEQGLMLVQIPTGAAGRYYTVEARARAGYDESLPGAAVLIHIVDTTDEDHPAHLVTHPGEPLTVASGMWRPGDVFLDAASSISISVDAFVGAGFRVTVRTGTAVTPAATIQNQLAAGRPGDAAGDAGAFPTLASSFAGVKVSPWTSGTPLLGLAAGASGSVWVVSAKAAGMGMSPEIQATAWEGQTWQAPQTLSSGWSSMPGDGPAIALSADNAAFIAWSGASRPFPTMTSAEINADIWLAARSTTGRWDAPVRINDDAQPAARGAMQLSPALSAGELNHLYVAWEDQRDGSRDIYFAELANGKPVGANRRINDDTSAAGDGTASQVSPAIAADANGNVHLLWVDLRNGASEIWGASRSPSGQWGRNVRLAAAGLDMYTSPSITVDGRGNAYAAWIAYPACGRANRETGTIMAALRAAGGEWQAAVAVAEAVDGGKESRPVIVSDTAGNVSLAWEEREGAGVAIRLARRTAKAGWSVGQVVALTEATAPTKPALAADRAGTLYLAWLAKDGNAEHLTLAPDLWRN